MQQTLPSDRPAAAAAAAVQPQLALTLTFHRGLNTWTTAGAAAGLLLLLHFGEFVN